jgi:hypothetical protein
VPVHVVSEPAGPEEPALVDVESVELVESELVTEDVGSELVESELVVAGFEELVESELVLVDVSEFVVVGGSELMGSEELALVVVGSVGSLEVVVGSLEPVQVVSLLTLELVVMGSLNDGSVELMPELVDVAVQVVSVL